MAAQAKTGAVRFRNVRPSAPERCFTPLCICLCNIFIIFTSPNPGTYPAHQALHLPMCTSLNGTKTVFQPKVNRKILFVILDGLSTDGDPRPIAQELCESGMTIVTCFLTLDSIHESDV